LSFDPLFAQVMTLLGKFLSFDSPFLPSYFTLPVPREAFSVYQSQLFAPRRAAPSGSPVFPSCSGSDFHLGPPPSPQPPPPPVHDRVSEDLVLYGLHSLLYMRAFSLFKGRGPQSRVIFILEACNADKNFFFPPLIPFTHLFPRAG